MKNIFYISIVFAGLACQPIQKKETPQTTIENNESVNKQSFEREEESYWKKIFENTGILLNPHPNLLAFECKSSSAKSMDLKKEKYQQIKAVSTKIIENTLILDFKFCSSLYMSKKNRGNIVVHKNTNTIVIFFHLVGEPVEELVEYEMNYKIKLDSMIKPKLEFIGKLFNKTINFTKENRVYFKK